MAALVLGLVVATAAVAAPDWMDCPTPCRCKWSSGKKTALCREAGFTSIPGTLDEDIQVLDLSGNAISKLSKAAFENVGLIHLQRIYLSNAGLTELHRDAFRNLTILIEVDLSHNDIREFHPMTFRGNERLRVLYLNGNPLTKLVRAQFPPLPHLRTLELEGCNLEYVHKDALIYLAALETLNLKYNLLRNISEATFVNLVNLKTLSLDSNPWRCDCDLRGFRNWFLSSKLYSLPLLCYEPLRLTGKHWGDVPSEEFACPPQLNPYPQLQVQAEAGGRITFGCRVTGDPTPQVSWLYDGYPINRTWIIIEAEDKWTNVSVNNVSESDVGTYTCLAKNLLDTASVNFSLVLPEVVTATTVSKSNNKVVWWGLLVVSLTVMFSAVVTITAVCCVRNKNLTQRRNLKASVSFTDQEKKLLDVSIATTTDRGSDSCEALGPEVEMMEPPVHITIEREPVSLAVFPPPPEFSTGPASLGMGAPPYGSIFIAVSVGRDPNAELARRDLVDVSGRPDLLDLSHRTVGTVTLPRRRPPSTVQLPHYDNMGPRVTAGGNSTLSLPDCDQEVVPPPVPHQLMLQPYVAPPQRSSEFVSL